MPIKNSKIAVKSNSLEIALKCGGGKSCDYQLRIYPHFDQMNQNQ